MFIFRRSVGWARAVDSGLPSKRISPSVGV
jgi:hypothetical protein